MKRKMGILLAMVLSIAILGVNGYAMPVTVEEGTFATEAAIIRDVQEILPVEVEEVEETEETEAEADAEAAEEAADPEDIVEIEAAEEIEAAAEEAVDAEATEETEEAEDAEAAEEAEEVEPEDDTRYALDTAEFHLLGRAADGSYVIFADQLFLKVSEEAISDILDQLDPAAVSALPDPAELEPLARNAKGDAVTALQENLIALGFLNGGADGRYGGGCQKAVSAFQAELGAPQTGAADQLTQMLILSALQQPATVVPHIDPAEMYAMIAGKTDVDLAKIAENGLRLDYDDIAGTGTISDRSVIEFDASGASDVDQNSFSVRFVLLVNQIEDGTVTIEPAMMVSCLCVRRPIMQEVILKSGDERHTFAIETLENSLSGARSVETATVVLDDATVAMLANAAEEGELKLRISGKYQTFDADLTEEQLASVSSLGAAAAGLN